MSRRTTNLLWFAAWLALMLVMVLGLVEARRRTIANLGSKEEIAKWQAYKAETEKQQSQPGPVQRKPIVSDEPPGLILMRDRFAVILIVAILMGSFFFGFLMMLIRGSLRTVSLAKENDRGNPWKKGKQYENLILLPYNRLALMLAGCNSGQNIDKNLDADIGDTTTAPGGIGSGPTGTGGSAPADNPAAGVSNPE